MLPMAAADLVRTRLGENSLEQNKMANFDPEASPVFFVFPVCVCVCVCVCVSVRTHRESRISGYGTEEKFSEKRKVFKEDLKEPTEVE